MRIIKTLISPVQYRWPVLASGPVKELKNIEEDHTKQKYWLDEMLDGGIRIPEAVWTGNSPPYHLLLQGPPGTGKTTFALELCLNATKQQLNSIYISAESTSASLIENALDFGWDCGNVWKYGDQQSGSPNSAASAGYTCMIFGSENDTKLDAKPDALFRTALKGWSANPLYAKSPEKAIPHLIVVDSLNVISTSPYLNVAPQQALLRVIREQLASAPKEQRPVLIVLILDTAEHADTHDFWEYTVDGCLRFRGSTGTEGYYQRTIQIVKMRTQPHAWGEHILKVYPGPPRTDKTVNTAAPQSRRLARPDKSPYLNTGGVFVFPSIHWQLSKLKQTASSSEPKEREFLKTPFDSFDRILGSDESHQGFPMKETTALVGSRGSMRSHFAFYFLLSHVVGRTDNGKSLVPHNALVISLRDDVVSTKGTLSTVLTEQGLASPGNGGRLLQELINNDRLGIVYNPPGYVSPAEFFHRIYVALARKREYQNAIRESNYLPPVCGARTNLPARERATIVVVDGLEHLNAKFPLCAKEVMFVPGIVHLFYQFNVCSVLVSGGDSAAASSHTNVQPLASLLLQFSSAESHGIKVNHQDSLTQRSVVTAVRVPGGQVGGKSGMLGRKGATGMVFGPLPQIESAKNF